MLNGQQLPFQDEIEKKLKELEQAANYKLKEADIDSVSVPNFLGAIGDPSLSTAMSLLARE